MKSARKARDLAATANAPLLFIGGKFIMDFDVLSAISTVGFPIAMALLLFWYLTKQAQNHREETNSLKDAITELKVAITSLITKIDEK